MSIKNVLTYAGAPNTERGRGSVISCDPKGTTLLYCSNSNVVMRNIADPLKVDFYTAHTLNVTCAKYSPSGYYIASGDQSGNVRIWATDNDDKTLKLEIRPISGAIRDIAWSPDSLRLVVVGEGKDSFSSVFLYDSGSTVGTLTGHNKPILTCDYIPRRPFCIATGGEDTMINFYKGPPFKTLDKSNRDIHKNYINCLRFAPNGDEFLTVSSDKTGAFFESKTGTKTGSLDSKGAHTGSIFSCSFTPNGKYITTSSADKTAKVWDSSSKTLFKTVTMGSGIDDQQLACISPSDNLSISLSLNGTLNYFDPSKDSETSPSIKYYGHNTAINHIIYDKDTNKLYSCASDGIIIQWEFGTMKNRLVSGKVEKVTFNTLAMLGKDLVVSSADGNLRFIKSEDFSFDGSALKLKGTPNDFCITSTNEVIVCAVHTGIELVSNKRQSIGFTATKYEPLCVSVSDDNTLIAVGGSDKKVRIYELKKDSVSELSVLEEIHTGKITRVKFSRDGKLLVSGDSSREIVVWETSGWTPKHTQLTYHTSSISDMCWSPNSSNLLTCGNDGNIIIWDFENKKRIVHPSHLLGVKSCHYINSNTVVSAGGDNRIRAFEYSF